MNAESTETQQPISPAKAVLFTIILMVVFLSLMEAGVRVWAYYFRSSYETFNVEKGRYEPVPGIHEVSTGPPLIINSKGFIGPEFEDRKPEGVYRIFSIGDSCTFGNMDFAYPGLAHTRLNAQGSGKKFEVINAGVEGYHSGFALARLKEDVLQYEPDLVTIYVGWNDFMKANPENLEEVGQHAGLARLMERSYLVKAYKKILFSYVRPLTAQPQPPSTDEDLRAYDTFEFPDFRDNLSEMIQILKARNIKVIVFTRPTVVREGMTQEDIDRQNVVFPWYGSGFSVNRLLSLHRSYNRTIRSVAEAEGVPLLDLAQSFEQYDKDELFWDTMHPNEKGQQLIADQLIEKLQGVM
jgi:lysophospholipase L1-like esterase